MSMSDLTASQSHSKDLRFSRAERMTATLLVVRPRSGTSLGLLFLGGMLVDRTEAGMLVDQTVQLVCTQGGTWAGGSEGGEVGRNFGTAK